MKKFILFLLLIFGNPIYSQTGWFPLNSGTNVDLFEVQGLPNNVVYAVGYSGVIPFLNGIVIKTTNSGSNWFSQYNNGISVYTGLTSLYFINENTGWLTGIVNAIYKTTNGGLNYFPQTVEGDWNRAFFLNSNTGWIIGEFGLSGRAIKTTNGGNNWIIKLNYNVQSFRSIIFINDTLGFISGGNGLILKTTNGGDNWTEFSVNSPIRMVSLVFPSSSTGFVAGFQTNIYKTTNTGNNWFLCSDNVGYNNSLSFINNQVGYLAGGFEFTSGVIKATSDGGFNWYEQYASNLELKSISFINSNTGYCVGINGQIVKTTNGGGALSITQISSEVPDAFNLGQNYPNPFNPSTKIKFSLPGSSLAKIVIYDILGKEISTLVNNRLAAGIYETEFNASGLPSGVYFYKLTTEDFSETKKMLLIK